MTKLKRTTSRNTLEADCDNCPWGMAATMDRAIVWREAITHTARLRHTVHVNAHKETILTTPETGA